MFKNLEYDESARSLTAEIDWQVPWDGETLWKYEMTFSEDFAEIESGHFRAFNDKGEFIDHIRFSNTNPIGDLTYSRLKSDDRQ